ncbi:MAG: helix-turn-helix domain-containing protein [Clostridia bacterium]|nr:helix-turn-helix domain-containing protein [Clostridia bacterium]MBQ1529188.1 helix-turn-helix domain-containing protein [Clostridia bacterium]MBR0364868.1 helix-turn-helix domain-containing protein [Clostridia bacterium]
MREEILEYLRPITEEEQAALDGREEVDRSLYVKDAENLIANKEGKLDVINSEKLLENGRIITVRPHTRFVHFPEHQHDYIEVIYMCSGSTTHIINGTELKLQDGELLFLGQNATQEILPAGENDIAVNLIVLPQFFDTALQMMGEEESPLHRFIIDVLTGENATGYLYFQVSDILPVQNLMENLLYTLIHNSPNRRNINQTTMGLLFLQLLNYTDRLFYEDDSEEEAVVQVLRYIENHYNDGSLSECADLLHYDFYWLSREIKKQTGKNYTDLLQEKRMAQAAFLLKTTKMNVADIALSIGYENVSYFHRLFGKTYGLSPKKYRTANQEVQGANG